MITVLFTIETLVGSKITSYELVVRLLVNNREF